MERIICLGMGYLFGIFQTGYLYGKTKNIDIRQHGSGNAGTTNTLRTLGWKAGAITFIGDLTKAILPIVLAFFLFRESYPESVKVLQMYAGLGAVLGHNYPFYLGFKGGKGIACTGGFILAAFTPMVPVCLGLFVASVAITRYVSLGSILVVISFFIQLVVMGQIGFLSVSSEYLTEVYMVGAVFSLMALWKHRANIGRLLSGTENQFGAGKKEK